jgi:hypothetical protein
VKSEQVRWNTTFFFIDKLVCIYAVTRKEIIEFSAGISSAYLCRKDSNKERIKISEQKAVRKENIFKITYADIPEFVPPDKAQHGRNYGFCHGWNRTYFHEQKGEIVCAE